MMNCIKREKYIFIIMLEILAFAACTGLALGSVHLSPQELLEAFTDSESDSAIIVFELRMPRVLGALLSGIALSASGLLLQCATNNDLCSPNVMGINSGAGAMVIGVLCFAPSLYGLIPVFAFMGAICTAFIVIGISNSVTAHSGKSTIILAGIAVGAFFNAAIGLMTAVFPDNMASYSGFTSGGFSAVQMSDVLIPSLLIIVGLVVSFIIVPKMNVLMVGDDVAASLGVHVNLLRITAIVTASLMCAASISYAGLIGFVGLLVPHIVRKLFHRDYRTLLPASCVMGGILVILADTVGRTMFAPNEISAGILLSVIGAPFFVIVLYRRQRER